MESRKFPIDKYKDAVGKIGADMKPLAVAPDFSVVFAFQTTGSKITDTLNQKVVLGNMVQEINFYTISTETGEIKNLGKFLSFKDFRFDETGKSFAFIDGSSNIYIYDLISGQLQKMVTADKWNSYYSLSWSKDSKCLMINSRMEFDIASRQFISIAVDSYTPFIKGKFSDNSYIVQMKNNEYNDMIAFYDFSSKSFTSIAKGIYIDSNNSNLIYTKDYMSELSTVSLKTLESKSVESGPIYCSYIMKSTGDILYTTLNNDLDSRFRYLLVKVNPDTMVKVTAKLNSPTFYLSPAEDNLYVISSSSSAGIVINTQDLRVRQEDIPGENADIYGIKTILLKMFQLDYKFNGEYDRYESKAKEVYVIHMTLCPRKLLKIS
jgi:hypothetical protein